MLIRTDAHEALTTARQEAKNARAELKHWLDLAAAHPDWKSPPRHIKGVRQYIAYLRTQPQDKPTIYARKRLQYWGKP